MPEYDAFHLCICGYRGPDIIGRKLGITRYGAGTRRIEGIGAGLAGHCLTKAVRKA